MPEALGLASFFLSRQVRVVTVEQSKAGTSQTRLLLYQIFLHCLFRYTCKFFGSFFVFWFFLSFIKSSVSNVTLKVDF